MMTMMRVIETTTAPLQHVPATMLTAAAMSHCLQYFRSFYLLHVSECKWYCSLTVDRKKEREEEGGREFCRWFRWADKIVFLGGAAAAAGLLAYCCWVSAFALLFQTQARSAYANRHRQSTSSIRLLRDDIYTTNCCCCCFLSSF